MEEEVRLGRFCIDHNITLDDLQLIYNYQNKLNSFFVEQEQKHINNYKDARGMVISSGNLEIDLRTYTLKKDGKILAIRNHEFMVLAFLACNPNDVILDREILSFLDVHGNKVEYRSMIVYLSRISKIIGNTPIDTKYIKRKRNKGYYWNFMTHKEG